MAISKIVITFALEFLDDPYNLDQLQRLIKARGNFSQISKALGHRVRKWIHGAR